MHMSNSGVHNLDLNDFRRLGDSQDAPVQNNNPWPPNYNSTERGINKESEVLVLHFLSLYVVSVPFFFSFCLTEHNVSKSLWFALGVHNLLYIAWYWMISADHAAYN